ncbi:hypothetical protein CXB51_014680 [Gossypium anomalum]|uniref:Reverse transcriptase Ty1/copia-type domain-containing protein n=1 Tax=Gossypium anomalum TaxID=47600 RepID=A0A8J5Z4T5_9ROSI|nr:hypothetical protein CXB51_014680 [Gossypium anomalum]
MEICFQVDSDGVLRVFSSIFSDGSLMSSSSYSKEWKIHQIDVKSAFLNGFLKEEIYAEQLDGFNVASEETKVYKLKKSLYGLKQAPRAWYDKIDSYLSSLGFKRSISEPNLYVKKARDETLLIVSLYVDDLLVTSGTNELLAKFKRQIENKAFALKILNKFCMQNCKEANTPVVIGEKLTSQGDFERCNVIHLQATTSVLRYIKGTLSYGVKFTKADDMKLIGFADSDWAGSFDDMKRTLGYLFTLRSVVFYWSSKRKLLVELNLHQREATKIKCDNQYVVAIAKNPMFHGKTKHFKIKFHFVKEVEQAHEIKLVNCNSEDQLADI